MKSHICKRIQKSVVLAISAALLCGCFSKEYTVLPVEVNDSESLYNITCDGLQYRDPFIYVDKEKQAYYCPVVAAEGIKIYKSRDLNRWRDLGTVYNYSGIYADYSWWAADMYKWKDNVYCIATAVAPNGSTDDFTSPKSNAIFKGEYGPEGAVWPVNKAQVNLIPQSDTQNIDGSLYVDENGTPWIVYCREAATEVTSKGYDAGVYAYKLNDDLSATVGEPVHLFNGSSSKYACAVDVRDGKDVYIADAPMLWREPVSGNLICIWSHYAKQPGNDSQKWYSIGQAVSRSGKIEGPWEHTGIINNYDGGHGCLFEDLDGNMKLAYHLNPSLSKNGLPHLVIKDIKVNNGLLEKPVQDPAVFVEGKEEEVSLKTVSEYHIPVNIVFCDSYSGNVTASMDQSNLQDLCDEYNIERKTSYPLLPSAAFTVTDALLGAGKLTADIVLNFNSDAIEADKEYLLPVKVTVDSEQKLELIDNGVYLIVYKPGRFEYATLDQTQFKIVFCNSSRAYEHKDNAQGELHLAETYKASYLIDGVQDKGWFSNFQWYEPFVQSREGVENGTDDYDYEFTDFHAFKGRRCAISIVIDMQQSYDVASVGLLNRRPNSAGTTDTKSVEFYVSDDEQFLFTPAKDIENYDFAEYGNPSQNNWTKIAENKGLAKTSSVQWCPVSEEQMLSHSSKGRFLKIRLLGTYDGSITLYSLSEIYVKQLTQINY